MFKRLWHEVLCAFGYHSFRRVVEDYDPSTGVGTWSTQCDYCGEKISVSFDDVTEGKDDEQD